MVTEFSITGCQPAAEHRDLPYHWVQWRTAYRQDEPELWRWNPKEAIWITFAGSTYSPERAAEIQWHYVAPALVPDVSSYRISRNMMEFFCLT